MTKILVVDDDLTALDIVDLMLEMKGFDVRRCTRGDQVRDSVKDDMPDLVLLDLMMPGVNGIKAAENIRKDGFKKPIIAFTAADDPEFHQQAVTAGCNLVLTKPCKPPVLVEHMERLIAEDEHAKVVN